VKRNRHDVTHGRASYSYESYALRAELKERPDDDYDVIRRRDLDLLSCGQAAATVAGDRRRQRCCLQRARAQWAPNQATAKCATLRNYGGGGNTPTDGDRRAAADVPPKKRVCYYPLGGERPRWVFKDDTVLGDKKKKIIIIKNCTQIVHHVKEAAVGFSRRTVVGKKM